MSSAQWRSTGSTLYISGRQSSAGKLLPELHFPASPIEEHDCVHAVEDGQIGLGRADFLQKLSSYNGPVSQPSCPLMLLLVSLGRRLGLHMCTEMQGPDESPCRQQHAGVIDKSSWSHEPSRQC